MTDNDLAWDQRPHVKANHGGQGVQAQRVTTPARLVAPFPWFGGKSRWAADIVQRLGDIEVYAEPFAGSLAVLLASPQRQREIVCDKDGMICNAFRAIQHDPDAVAHWADYPTIHQDLTARRHWLADWRDANAERLSVDPLAYDAQAAGWWIWCLSSWIGGSGDMLRRRIDQIPHVGVKGGGHGVQAQRKNVPGGMAKDKVPFTTNSSGGRGVQAQRIDVPGGMASDRIPFVHNGGGGQGVQAQRISLEGRIGTGDRLCEWMSALADRLSGVVVLNRDWKSAVTPTLLQHTRTAPKPPVGVFLDPPYLLGERSEIYDDDTSDDPARDAYQWALEHGETYRIAYAAHEGDFEIPDGWDVLTRTFGGINDPERVQAKRDLVMFSPACVHRTVKQPMLF